MIVHAPKHVPMFDKNRPFSWKSAEYRSSRSGSRSRPFGKRISDRKGVRRGLIDFHVFMTHLIGRWCIFDLSTTRRSTPQYICFDFTVSHRVRIQQISDGTGEPEQWARSIGAVLLLLQLNLLLLWIVKAKFTICHGKNKYMRNFREMHPRSDAQHLFSRHANVVRCSCAAAATTGRQNFTYDTYVECWWLMLVC